MDSTELSNIEIVQSFLEGAERPYTKAELAECLELDQHKVASAIDRLVNRGDVIKAGTVGKLAKYCLAGAPVLKPEPPITESKPNQENAMHVIAIDALCERIGLPSDCTLDDLLNTVESWRTAAASQVAFPVDASGNPYYLAINLGAHNKLLPSLDSARDWGSQLIQNYNWDGAFVVQVLDVAHVKKVAVWSNA